MQEIEQLVKELTGQRFRNKETGEVIELVEIYTRNTPVGEATIFGMRPIKKNRYGEQPIFPMLLENIQQYFVPIGKKKNQ